MAAQQWWVIWTSSFSSVKNLSHTYHVVQLATAPADGSHFDGETVTQVQGPYATKADAQKAIGASGTTGQGGLPSPDPASPQANKSVTNPLSGLAAVGDFFSRLTQAATWERIGEVVLGLLLIAVGVAHITHAVPIATKVAGAAALAA